jgi:hypothetical protein
MEIHDHHLRPRIEGFDRALQRLQRLRADKIRFRDQQDIRGNNLFDHLGTFRQGAHAAYPSTIVIVPVPSRDAAAGAAVRRVTSTGSGSTSPVVSSTSREKAGLSPCSRWAHKCRIGPARSSWMA